MKTKRFISSLILFTVVFTACKKSGGNANTDDGDKTKGVKLLTRVIHVKGGVTDFITYTYDDQNRLAGIATSGFAKTTYSYFNNNLSAINSEAKDGSNVIVNNYGFIYDNSRLKAATRKIFVNDVLTKDYSFDYVYSGNQVTEIHQNPGNIITSYTYNGGNIETVTTGAIVTKFTYDTKKSKFTNAGLKNLTGLEADDRYSANNILSSTSGGLNINYTYAYDDDGYPTAATTANDKYTYVYEVR